MIGRDKKTPEEQKKSMAKSERESGDAAISLIAPGMNIVGDCETDGTIRIEGRVEGTIRAGKSVVVGRSGEVIGDIITQDAVVSGRVSGNIAADSRLELQSTCDIQGELRSRRVQLDEGARFNGQVHMEESGGSRVVKPAGKLAAPEVKAQGPQPAPGGD
jgi:cytoskeletal protein CcmA (bactofilin family)